MLLKMICCHQAFPAMAPSIGKLLYSLSYRNYDLARWFIGHSQLYSIESKRIEPAWSDWIV